MRHPAFPFAVIAVLGGCGARTPLSDPAREEGHGGSSGTSVVASSSAQSSTATGSSLCGNDIVDSGEACDLGPLNANRPAFLLTQNNINVAGTPVLRPKSAALFYDYFSSSGHTGFEQLMESETFLYADTETATLSLFFLHGIDLDTSGESQPASHVIMDVAGLPPGISVALSDDNSSEFDLNSPTSAHGDWTFHLNSDGGVLSGFPFPGNWSIQVSPQFLEGINGWQYLDSSGAPTTLGPASPATLTAFGSPSKCRLDCTIPKCGDGILDGGEVCDDGNDVGGDGCAADCKSFN